MLQKIRKLFSEKGQGIVEYALILGFVAIVTVGLFGENSLKSTFTNTLKGIMAQFTKYNETPSETSSETPSGGNVVEPGGPNAPAG